VFLEVPGGLRRDKGIQQALIETKRDAKTPENSRLFGVFVLWMSILEIGSITPNSNTSSIYYILQCEYATIAVF
jgi:hypothetical protein